MTSRSWVVTYGLIVVCSAAALSAGQTGAVRVWPKGMVLKGKAPVSKTIPIVHVPAASETTLRNGLTLLVVPHRRQPLAFELIVRGAGGYYDPAERPGLAALTASMLTEGTAARSGRDTRRQLDAMAAVLRVDAAPASPVARISGSILSDQFAGLADVLADLVRHPAFADASIDTLKQRAAGIAAQQRGGSLFLATELLVRRLYGSHPAARVEPPPAATRAISRDDLVKFHASAYRPGHVLLAIAGDVSAARARAIVERAFGDWSAEAVTVPPVTEPEEPPEGQRGISLIDRPKSVQTMLAVGVQAVDRADPDYDTLNVLHQILGAGATSRLYLNLREDKGYTYVAGTRFNGEAYRGSLRALSSVGTDVTEPALAEILNEIARLRDERVPADELDEVKRAMAARFAISLESPEAILALHTTRWLYRLPPDYWSRYTARVMAVTADDVVGAAKRYLAPSRLQIVAVGDAERIAGALKTFGAVDTYDANGAPTSTPR